MEGTRLYSIWVGMRQRCRNPKATDYAEYGGRGITIDLDWETYTGFQWWALNNGYAHNLSIERSDVDGHYTPKNCYWATNSEQQSNKRKRANTASKYLGVYPLPQEGRWRAIIHVNKVRKHIGCYGTELGAAQARDEYVRANKLAHKLNF